ncbi:MAG: SoxR reducing system RseC family protein [Desulfobacteraceae bacterium]|nr:SoxR reducing system RseC family protein [Desulfobacteraceae bacterium]
MAIEQGIVIRMDARALTAWVQTTRSSVCESCASRESCNPGGNGKNHEVEAINSIGAKVGDHIQIAISSSSLLKAMFMLYIFPILGMLGGGIAGNALAPGFQMNPSVLAAIMALVCFAIAMIIMRFIGQRLGQREAYRPKIIRILGRQEQLFPNECGQANYHR